MSNVLSSDVRDLLARYHREASALRDKLNIERTSSGSQTHQKKGRTLSVSQNTTSACQGRPPSIPRMAADAGRLDRCEVIRTEMKQLEHTFVGHVQRQLQKERGDELRQLSNDCEVEIQQFVMKEELTKDGGSVERGSLAPSTTVHSARSPNVEHLNKYQGNAAAAVGNSTFTSGLGSKMSLMPKKKVNSILLASEVRGGPSSSSNIPPPFSATTSSGGPPPHQGTWSTTTSMMKWKQHPLCLPARAAIAQAKRLEEIGEFAEAADALRRAKASQLEYDYEQSIPSHPRLFYGNTPVGTRRSAKQLEINSTQFSELCASKFDNRVSREVNKIRQRYLNAAERLKHKHTIEQNATHTMIQLAMSAPAEEKQCSAVQRRINRNVAAVAVREKYNQGSGIPKPKMTLMMPHDDPDEMRVYVTNSAAATAATPYRSPRGGAESTATSYVPVLLSSRTSTPVLNTTSRPLTARSVVQRPTSPPHHQHHPLRQNAPHTSSSSGRKDGKNKMKAADHSHSVSADRVLTSGSVLDGVAAPAPFGTRPLSAKRASSRRPQTAGARVGCSGNAPSPSSPPTPLTPRCVSTTIPDYTRPPPTLCDLYGNALFQESIDHNTTADDYDENTATTTGAPYQSLSRRTTTSASKSSLEVDRQGINNQTKKKAGPLEAFCDGAAAAAVLMVPSGSRLGFHRHNPKVNVSGARYLRAVALNRQQFAIELPVEEEG